MATTLRPDEFTDEDERWMRAALVEAEGALNRWEVPVGCVVVRDGEAVATGSNRTNELRNGTRHAEFEAIDALLKRHGGDPRAVGFDRCDLYVTCEPCIMCAGALSVLGFGRCITGAATTSSGGTAPSFPYTGTDATRAAPPGTPRGRAKTPSPGTTTPARARGRRTRPTEVSLPAAVKLLQDFYYPRQPESAEAAPATRARVRRAERRRRRAGVTLTTE